VDRATCLYRNKEAGIMPIYLIKAASVLSGVFDRCDGPRS
jgi:hypothetical protein